METINEAIEMKELKVILKYCLICDATYFLNGVATGELCRCGQELYEVTIHIPPEELSKKIGV